MIHALLEATARRAPDREALVLHDPGAARVTYGALAAAARRFSRLCVALGVAPGDRVAILAHNGLEYAAAYYGALAAGAIAVPLNTAADPASLLHYLHDSGASTLLVGPRLERVVVQAAARFAELPALTTVIMAAGPAMAALGKAAPLGLRLVPASDADERDDAPLALPLTDDDVASIIYTSGSTGRPRGATLTHGNVSANVSSIVRYLGLTEDDRVLAVLPFYYVYGKSVLNTAVAVGATVVVENRFQYPNVALDTLEAERCTGFAGVPSTFAILAHRSNLAERVAGGQLAALRWVTQAGGGMSPTLTRELLAMLPGRQVFVMYGATEASARLSYVPPDELPGCVGSIGRAIPDVELTVRRPDGTPCAVDEPGELFARGPNIMRGYWHDPDATAAVLGPHGYATGDLARTDAAGRLWLVGRKQDMLKVGGHRVAAREIEDAILEHPGILEAAVIGVPDELLGDKLRAFIVPRTPGAPDAPDAAALKRFLKERLPAYKIPDDVVVRDALPKNPSGKVMKDALRADG